MILLESREFERAAHHADQAVALNPNDGDAVAYRAYVLCFLGRAEEALADARRALASGIPVPPEDLLKLADARAQRVRDALLANGEIDAGRLFLTPPAPDGTGARVFLQLR